MAAAAWSWVEKMLQLVQVTSAPRAVRVSMRTAVWMAENGVNGMRNKPEHETNSCGGSQRCERPSMAAPQHTSHGSS